MALQTAPSQAPPETRGPSPLPLGLLWGAATLLSAEVALALLWPLPESRAVAMLTVGGALMLAAAVAVVARDPLMELLSELDYQAQAWLAVAHLAIFLAPLVLLRLNGLPAPWPLGCVALAVPLTAALVYPRSCHRLLADLLLLWWGLLAMRPEAPPVWPLLGFALLLLATGATHLHFRHQRHRRSGLSLAPVWIGVPALLAIAVPLALGVWWLIPPGFLAATAARGPDADQAALAQAASGGPLAAGDAVASLRRVLFETALVLVAACALVLLTGHLLRRLRSRRRPVPLIWPDELVTAEPFSAPPTRRRRHRRGEGPRARIIAAYHDATQRLADRGWPFPPAMTAREFLSGAQQRDLPQRAGEAPPRVADALADLTALFERAKYSAAEITESDLSAALSAAQAVARAAQNL